MIHPRFRAAFTLIELLVVIAIIGVLVAMLVPAVQRAREIARRNTCQNNLSHLGVAVLNHEMGHGSYPPGSVNPTGPIENVEHGLHHNWISHLLPYLDQNNAFRQIDFQVSVYDPKNAPVRRLSLRTLYCPSSTLSNHGPAGFSNYAAVYHDQEAPIDVDNNGVFFLNSHIRFEDVIDGTSQTLFLGEKIVEANDLGWMSGTRATLRNTGIAINVTGRPPKRKKVTNPSTGDEQPPNGNEPSLDGPNEVNPDSPPLPEVPPTTPSSPPTPTPTPTPTQANDPPKQVFPLNVGGFGSWHGTFAIFVFGDGRTHILHQTIDPQVYRQLGNRADRKLLDERDY